MVSDPSLDAVAGASVFPETSWNRILRAGARDSDEAAVRADWERLAVAYWRPIYVFIRRKAGVACADAQDLTQAFFVHLMETGFLAKADPARGRFRSFLRTSVANFLADHWKAADRLRRGGGRAILSLDAGAVAELEQLLPSAPSVDADAAFDAEWRRGLIAAALGDLEQAYRAEGRPLYFEVLRRRDLAPGDEPVGYAELADALALRESDVRNYLHHARARLRRLVEERVRDTCSGSAELQDELAAIFGS